MIPHALPIHDLAQACRIFMGLAYPDGIDTVPENRRPYFDISADASVDDFLPPAPLASSICQDLSKLKGGLCGFDFRLGSAKHPHLKLRVQPMDFHERKVWVYSVDTHDRFLLAAPQRDAEEMRQWRALVEHNRALKHDIEDALALAGFLTPKGMLQIDLTSAS
jgi:hypothetical protein